MIDRLAMAKESIQEQLKQRDDAVAAYIEGSVARGQVTEASDIDLTLVVRGHPDPDPSAAVEIDAQRMGTWREGVYLDWNLRREETLTDLLKIMHNPYVSTSINEALIVHDPTGFLTKLQKKVKAIYMEPEWVQARVRSFLQSAQKAMPGLEDAFERLDSVGICGGLGPVLFSFAVAPLHRIGVIPSSTRQLAQLADYYPELTSRVRELEGSEQMDPEGVSGLIPLVCTDAVALVDRSSFAGLPEYFAEKAKWMADNGLHREALHFMWTSFGKVIGSIDPPVRNEASNLCQRWLHGVGWEGEPVLNSKRQLVRSLMEEMKALADDIPTVGVAL